MCIRDRHEAVRKAVDLYVGEIERYDKNEEKAVDIWMFILPEIIFERCKPQSVSYTHLAGAALAPQSSQTSPRKSARRAAGKLARPSPDAGSSEGGSLTPGAGREERVSLLKCNKNPLTSGLP